MPVSGPFRVNTPHVIAESVDGEVLIVNLLTGAYYSSAGVGDAAWAMFANGADLHAVAARIAGHFGLHEEAVAADIAAWLADLITEGLLVEDDGQPRDTPAAPAMPADYAPPAISKYTDMEDLLLLDPVHEVDDVGWPAARTGV
jgi:hypothetical protein